MLSETLRNKCCSNCRQLDFLAGYNPGRETNGDDVDDPDNFSIVTDELTYENGQTILSITDNVGQGEGAQERYDRSEKGWDKILEGLKELVEKEEGQL